MNEINYLDLRVAWLAGIIDGEGTVCLGYVRSGARSGRKISVLGRFEVAVGNTDEAMLNEVMAVADVLGIGYVYVHDRVRRRNDKTCNRVVFMGMKRVRAILEAVFPYLITKHARAEAMLRAIRHRQSSRTTFTRKNWRVGKASSMPGYAPVSEDPVFAEYVTSIKAMNRRGRIPGEAVNVAQFECSQRTPSAESARTDVVGGFCERQHPHLDTGTVTREA